MKIALTDDEPKENEHLAALLEAGFRSAGTAPDVLDVFLSGEAFLQAWRPGMYDLIFLDLYMGGLSGVDVARKIREKDRDVQLVFCTTSNEYASESYEVAASYYLRKPVSAEDVRTMIERLNLRKYELIRFVTLPDGQRLIPRNIVYTECGNHSVLIHCGTGPDIQVRITQSALEQTLAGCPFLICCSKGILVNLYEVARREGDVFLMRSGVPVPISRRRSKEADDAYTDFLFRKLRKEMVK